MKLKVVSNERMFIALAVTIGIVALTLSLTTGAAASPRSGNLHITKECSQYQGLANQSCTITSSNVKAIGVDSTVTYATAADFNTGVLDTDIVLYAGPGNTSTGHCVLNLATGTGLCTLSGGTGKFTHLHATADVSHLGGFDWAWDGTYSFSPTH